MTLGQVRGLSARRKVLELRSKRTDHRRSTVEGSLKLREGRVGTDV